MIPRHWLKYIVTLLLLLLLLEEWNAAFDRDGFISCVSHQAFLAPHKIFLLGFHCTVIVLVGRWWWWWWTSFLFGVTSSGHERL
jgi:hypothetical protein